jgi:zinc protease
MAAKNKLPRIVLVIIIFAVALVIFFTGGSKDILRTKLSNGLQVIIVRNTLAPVVTTMVNYRVGSDETPAGFPGTAHATEHMMFRGSPGLSADQLAAISAAFGGDDNADTQQAVTQYFFTTPAENLEVALRVEATRMQDLLPDESLWTKERGAIEQEVAAQHLVCAEQRRPRRRGQRRAAGRLAAGEKCVWRNSAETIARATGI